MKTLYIIPLALTLLGCSTTTPRTARLTVEQARVLARQLANAKAHALFNTEPFLDGPQPQFIQGHWTWHDLRGQGNGDIEATVEFAVDGANPDVSVTELDNHAILP
jgi:hypothetical protein